MNDFTEKHVTTIINVPKGRFCKFLKDDGEKICCDYLCTDDDAKYVNDIWTYGCYCNIFGFVKKSENKKSCETINKHHNCIGLGIKDWRK